MAHNLTSGGEEKSAVHTDAPVHEDVKGDPDLNAGDAGGEHTPAEPKYDDVTQRLVAQAQGIAAGVLPASQAVSHVGSAPIGALHDENGVGVNRIIHQGDLGGAVKAAQKYANDQCHPWDASTGSREGGDSQAGGPTSDPMDAQIDAAVDSAKAEIKADSAVEAAKADPDVAPVNEVAEVAEDE